MTVFIYKCLLHVIDGLIQLFELIEVFLDETKSRSVPVIFWQHFFFKFNLCNSSDLIGIFQTSLGFLWRS